MLDLTAIRRAEPSDATALAELHAEAWRFAYRGIIPGSALERMIARRGAIWWRAVCEARDGVLVLEFDGRVAGYATFGLCGLRSDSPMGEIYGLYVKPECHGAGFGRALFDAAPCRFYRALGGRRRFRTCESLGGARLEEIGFHWR